MKIWLSFSGEHSAKLRIIGTFKTSGDADKAAACFNDLLTIENKKRGSNLYFSDEVSQVMTKHKMHLFSENDPEQLDFFQSLHPEDRQIIINTDEVEIQALIKIMINYGAKIEIYSKHDYPA